MSVRRRGASCLVFLIVENSPHVAGEPFPFDGWMGMEYLRECAPSAVPREQYLLRFRRFAVFGFDELEDANGRDVIARFFF